MKLPETESLNTYNCKVNIFKKKIGLFVYYLILFYCLKYQKNPIIINRIPGINNSLEDIPLEDFEGIFLLKTISLVSFQLMISFQTIYPP